MRSPISSVGNIELDGILKGSTIKERTMNTASRPEKNPLNIQARQAAARLPFESAHRHGRLPGGAGAAGKIACPRTTHSLKRVPEWQRSAKSSYFYLFRASRIAALAALRLLAVL